MSSLSTGAPEFCGKLSALLLSPALSQPEYRAVETCAWTSPKQNKDNHNVSNRALVVGLDKFLFITVSSLLASPR
jgi:hypothetical protein